jgi:ParB family chromosome partitioning protein
LTANLSNEAASLAALNVSLLEAIKVGGHEGRQPLADAAGIAVNNLNRKIDSLVENGLIVRTGEATHEVALTETGQRALDAMAVWRGEELPAAGDGATLIPFDRIDPWPGNPRTYFDEATTEDLAQSIADKGVQQAIVVRPTAGGRFQVIIGERRRRASTLAVERGWASPDFRVPAKVRDVTDDEAEELAGIENIQREDMHWMDLARYFRHLMDVRHRSGPQLERLFGRRFSARKIQDYAKIARELPAAQQADAYRPDGDKLQLTYVHARDLVGEKKAKPALDLPPRQALALAELIHLSGPYWPAAKEAVAKVAQPPAGGPLGALTEKKLIGWRFVDGKPAAVIAFSEEVHAWLAQMDYASDPDASLRRLRETVIGALETNALAPGEYVTPELNAPEPAAAASVTEPPMPPTEAQLPRGDAEPSASAPGPSLDEPFARDGAERDPPSSPLAGEAEPAAAAAPAQARLAEPEELPPFLAIVVVEAAHRIGREGEERGPGTWAVPVLASYYLDQRGQKLVFRKLIAFMGAGERTLVCLTKAGREWLEAEGWGATHEGGELHGQPEVDDNGLKEAQLRYLGGASPHGYSTPWLNPPAQASAPAAQAGPATNADTGEVTAAGQPLPPFAGDHADDRRDDFTRQILKVSRQDQATRQLAGAARQAVTYLNSLRGRSRAPKADEIDAQVALLSAGLEAITPHLDDEAA